VLEKCKTFGTIAVRERRQWVGLFRKIGPKVAHDLRTERPKVPHISNLNRRVGCLREGVGGVPVDPGCRLSGYGSSQIRDRNSGT
jgi:hypothetical protein